MAFGQLHIENNFSFMSSHAWAFLSDQTSIGAEYLPLSLCKRLFFYIIDSKFAEKQVQAREIFCLEDTDGQVLAKDCDIL